MCFKALGLHSLWLLMAPNTQKPLQGVKKVTGEKKKMKGFQLVASS